MAANELQDLKVDRKGRVRRNFSPMFLLGNLLIVGGLLLLLGIGGWYGYQAYSNDQYTKEFALEGGTFEPTPIPVVAGAEIPTPTAEPAPPPPKLPSGPNVINWQGIVQQVDNSPPVRLSIPSVAIDSPIVPITWAMIPSKNGGSKSEWQVADFAVGHHFGSANPGQVGNVVMSGHVDYKGSVFKDLDKAKKGDEVVVYTEKGQYLYVITDRVIVKEEGATEEQKRMNAAYMNPTPDQTLTMITCWPYGIDTHRLIVIAKPYQSNASAQAEFILR
ncbi:MAG: sortase [Chloroflexota bacterium]